MTDDFLTRHVVDKETLLSAKDQEPDQEPEMMSLRPRRLSEYIGQPELVSALEIAISAAQARQEALDHLLFHGPPGLGKTTLAHIIAREMGGNLTLTSGPALEKAGDLIGMLSNMGAGDILFIDEIHRLPKVVEEFLYSAMEDFAIDVVFDKGVNARSHRFQLKRFTVIGATTRVGLLSAPLRDRFGIFRSLDFYSHEDLVTIAKRSARLLEVEIHPDGAMELSVCSRGTPRIVNRLLRRVRDYAQVKGEGKVTPEIVKDALSLEGVDEKGLTDLDRRYLRTIIEFYKGGPVGIDAIAATLQEEADTLVDVVEPYLLKEGMVLRTSAGRKASEKAYQHLGFSTQRVF